MASSWIVKRGDKEAGPFTSPELKTLADSGQLRRTDLVTKKGANRFVNAEEVKGLFSPASGKSQEKKGPAKAAADYEEPDYGTVEIIEEEPVVVLAEAADEFDVVDYDYEDDFEEPQPARSRRSRNRAAAPVPVRAGGSRRGSALKKPDTKRKPAKKNSDSDEEEDGPWANLAYGLACLAGGVLLFIAMSNEDPNTWETNRRGGLLVAIVKLIYNIGGRWTVLGFLVMCSGLFFWSAANQFRKR